MSTFKKVRFANDSRHYPSSVHSMDTPPSPSIPLPGPVPRPHPLLEASAVNWDMMKHSSTVTRNKHPLPGRALHEPATAPPQPSLSISSIYLPWIIDVYASNGSYVSVGDVLDTIYHSLRTNITTTEFHFFPYWNERVRVTRAYELRYRKFRDTFGNESEKHSGIKRIDFLMI